MKKRVEETVYKRWQLIAITASLVLLFFVWKVFYEFDCAWGGGCVPPFNLLYGILLPAIIFFLPIITLFLQQKGGYNFGYLVFISLYLVVSLFLYKIIGFFPQESLLASQASFLFMIAGAIHLFILIDTIKITLLNKFKDHSRILGCILCVILISVAVLSFIFLQRLEYLPVQKEIMLSDESICSPKAANDLYNGKSCFSAFPSSEFCYTLNSYNNHVECLIEMGTGEDCDSIYRDMRVNRGGGHGENAKDLCFISLALRSSNSNFCEKIKDEYSQSECLLEIAARTARLSTS